MAKKRVLFVEPCGSRESVVSTIMALPLMGPLSMGTIVHNAGHEVKIIKESLLKEKELYQYLEWAEVLILTLLTNSAKRGYELARTFKQMHPTGKTIAGGIHVSLVPEEALPFVDQVATGEGQNIILDLVEGKIPEKLVHGNPVENLDTLPIPDYSLLVGYQKLRVIPMMTSLGCPFGCTFCCVTEMYGRKYRIQSAERTIAEIKQHFKLFGVRPVSFFDDNFCANKPVSLELFNKMKEQNLQFKWICQVRADLTKDEGFIQRMAEAGCRRVFVGFESINNATLKDFNKHATSAEVENAIKVFHKYGIAIHGMFIFGSDEDDASQFQYTTQFVLANHIETAQGMLLTPFPQTTFWKNLDKSRIVDDDWNHYEGFHVLISPKKMTQRALMEGVVQFYKKIYSAGSILRQFGHDLRHLFKKDSRGILYRTRKMFNNFERSIGFGFTFNQFVKKNKSYIATLSD